MFREGIPYEKIQIKYSKDNWSECLKIHNILVKEVEKLECIYK